MPEPRPTEECIDYCCKPDHGPHVWSMPSPGVGERWCPGKRTVPTNTVPTNAELAEAAQGKTLFDVYRGWLERHPMRRVGLDQTEIDTWLDWAAQNLISDPEIGAVTRRISELHMEATEVETVMQIVEYLRQADRSGWTQELANRIEQGAWHKYSKEPEQSNPELWR